MSKPEKIKRIEDPILIENARIIYRNFAGEKQRYNAAGYRNFHVVIEDEGLATMLMQDGWNLKKFKARPDDEDVLPGYHMQVVVSFESQQPPRIVMITNKKAVILSEETVSLLDSAEIIKCDLEIRPYNWQLATGEHGVKAYLKTIYATIKADPFAEKYSDLEFSKDVMAGTNELPVED